VAEIGLLIEMEVLFRAGLKYTHAPNHRVLGAFRIPDRPARHVLVDEFPVVGLQKDLDVDTDAAVGLDLKPVGRRGQDSRREVGPLDGPAHANGEVLGGHDDSAQLKGGGELLETISSSASSDSLMMDDGLFVFACCSIVIDCKASKDSVLSSVDWFFYINIH